MSLVGHKQTPPTISYLFHKRTLPMETSDARLFKLWSVGFRTLSFGVVVLGALATLFGAGIAVVASVSRGASTPGLSFGSGVLFSAAGVVFVMIGNRGRKIRRREDLVAEIDQTAKDRDKLEQLINR
jgi:membrane protein implicated in regulation of membrane protease activity